MCICVVLEHRKEEKKMVIGIEPTARSKELLPAHKKIKPWTMEGAFSWNKEHSSTGTHGFAIRVVSHEMLVLVKKQAEGL